MSRVCQVTGKRPTVGNNRSHARNATRRRFYQTFTLTVFGLRAKTVSLSYVYLLKVCVSSIKMVSIQY